MDRRSLRRLAFLVLGTGLVACSDSMSSLLSDGRSNGESPRGDGGEGSYGPAPADTPDGADKGILLVHAAGLGAFRVCFDAAAEQLPQPDRQTMPEANVVGVEVGTAVRLPPLERAATKVYVWEEKRLRDFTGPRADRELSCGELLGLSDPSIPRPLTSLSLDGNLTVGVHLLVLTGCGPDPAGFQRTKEQCGDDFDGTTGNLKLKDILLTGTSRTSETVLPTQVLHLSQPIESRRGAEPPGTKLVVTFGDLGSDGEEVASDPPLFGAATPATPQPLALDPEDIPAYAQRGFTVKLGATTLFTQSLADVARLSSVTELPSTYYATASNYVLLLLGDPSAPPRSDAGADLEGPHFLVVPVVDATTDDADGGT